MVDERLAIGGLWPDPLIQLNPAFERGRTIDELTAEVVLHEQCQRVFRIDRTPEGGGRSLHLHQEVRK